MSDEKIPGRRLRSELPAEVPAGQRTAGQEPDAESAPDRDPEGGGSRRPRTVPAPARTARPEAEERPGRRAPLPAQQAGERHTAEERQRETHEQQKADGQRRAGENEERGESEAEEAPGEPGPTGRQRLVKALWPPRASRAQFIVALLLCGLGFGLAIQVASTSDNSPLRGARQEDLVRILDELDDRTQRLQDEKQSLQDQRTELENSSDHAEEARRQTAEKERQLGILAGTVAAQGPGITLTIDDAKGTVKADMLLDAIQELRAAGAEAIQVNDVRIVAGSYVTDVGDDISVDGHRIGKPYRFKVIGKPEDLEPALNIPGGVVQTLEKEQAAVAVKRAQTVVVDALRPAKRPDHARSSSR